MKSRDTIGEHQNAGVMELADVVDSKSTGSDTVPVRVRPPAPKNPECVSVQDFYLLPLTSSLLPKLHSGFFGT